MTRSVAPWLDAPLADFVRQARVGLAVALEPSGRVLAQHGFTRSLDVMAVCSLVAAIHASGSELGRQANGAPFGPLHHSGEGRQVFLAPAAAGSGTVLVLAVFDQRTSLGIVRHFFGTFAQALQRVSDDELTTHPMTGDFERDLGRNLAMLFGRA
ncbi:MAG TPA: hypothetical protein VFZ73_09665 [Gemmatimonadaceae bacterium]